MGLMIAMEFSDATPGVASAVTQAALKHELILLTTVRTCGLYSKSVRCCVERNDWRRLDLWLGLWVDGDVCLCVEQGAFETIRFIPPLNITESELNMVLDRYGKALADVFAAKP